jgi:cold shock CspA family protein
MKGTVRWFDKSRGSGFILDEDGNDVYIFGLSLKIRQDIKKIDKGIAVEFSRKRTPRGYMAIDTEIVESEVNNV